MRRLLEITARLRSFSRSAAAGFRSGLARVIGRWGKRGQDASATGDIPARPQLRSGGILRPLGWRQAFRSARLPRGLRPWFIASAILLVVHWSLTIIFVVPQLGTLDFLRLHYTVAFGIDWIDCWYMIFVFPVFGAAALGVNAWLVLLLAARYRGLAAVVSQATLFVEAALVVGGVSAILLNA